MFREEVQPFEIGLESLVNASCEVLPFSFGRTTIATFNQSCQASCEKTMIHPVKTGKSSSITIIQLIFMSYIIHYCDDTPSGIHSVPFPFKYNVRESLYELQT